MFEKIAELIKEKNVYILIDKYMNLKNISKSIYLYSILQKQNKNVKILGNFELIEKHTQWLLKIGLKKEAFTQNITKDSVLINLNNNMKSVWTNHEKTIPNQVIYFSIQKKTDAKENDIEIISNTAWNNLEIIFNLKNYLKIENTKDISIWQALSLMCNNGSFISTTNNPIPVNIYIDALKLLNNSDVDFMKNHKKSTTKKQIAHNGEVLSRVVFNNKIAYIEFEKQEVLKNRSLTYSSQLFNNIQGIDWTLTLIKDEKGNYTVNVQANYALQKQMYQILKQKEKTSILLANKDELDKFFEILNKISSSLKNSNDNNIPSAKDDINRLGFWNILNDSGKKDFKDEAIAKTIHYIHDNLVGLVEVLSEKAVQKIVADLNEVENNLSWKYIISDKTTSLGGSHQSQYYAFIWEENLFEIIPFSNGEKGMLYPNPALDNELVPGSKTNFVRPPFSCLFKHRLLNKTVNIIISHNDAPGVAHQSKGKQIIEKQSTFPGQGTQEVWEAKHMEDVVEYFGKINNKSKIMFMSDTNIQIHNGDKPFKNMISHQFENTLNPNENITSLGMKEGRYSNPYDKAFTNIKNTAITDKGFYPLYDVFNDHILSKEEFKEKLKKEKKSYKNIIRSGISDHSSIFVDIDFNKE